MLLPRRHTFLVVGFIAGIFIGATLGYNYGRGVPLLSNPFSKKKVSRSIRRAGGRLLHETGRALEKSGRDLKKVFER